MQPTTIAELTVLTCLAPHPRANEPRFAGRTHGIRLQVLPFLVRPTFRVVKDWSEVSTGCIGVKCSSSNCRMISEYVVVGTPRSVRQRSGEVE